MATVKKSLLDKLIEVFVSILILAGCLVLFINVVLRALGYSLKWAEELTRYLIVWVTFIGGSLCVRDGSHVGVDVLMQKLGEKGKTRLSIIINLICLAFMAVMTYLGVQMVLQAVHFKQITPALLIPMAVPYLAIPVGSLLMVLRYIQLIWALLKDLKGKEVE